MIDFASLYSVAQRTADDAFEFDSELGILLSYYDEIDECDDHFSATRIYVPVELGPQPA